MSEAAALTGEGNGSAPVVDTSGAATAGGESQAAAAGNDTVAAAAGSDTVTAASEAGPLRPEGLPDEFWEDGKGVRIGDLWTKFQELTAAAEAAKADVPADANGYELKVSDAVKVPEGFAVEIDPKAPFFADITKELHALGVGKAGVQKLVDAYAREQINLQTAAAETYAAEKTKLGENGAARLEAVDNWLRTNLPKEQAAALIGSKTSAAHVAAFEKLIKLRSDAPAAQGGGAKVSALDGLKGEAMLDQIRAQAA